MPKKQDTRTPGQVRASKRQRVFATVVYPESAPADWKERLDAEHIDCVISPLHDKDKNPDGEFKKPHYHIMVLYPYPVDFESKVKPVFDEIGAVGREKINSTRGYARYLCHLDNPEKAQYDKADIKTLGGIDYNALIHLPTDDAETIHDIQMFIKANNIFCLSEFLEIAYDYNRDWYNLVVTAKGYIVDKIIKAYYFEATHKTKDGKIICPETGEIITPKKEG